MLEKMKTFCYLCKFFVIIVMTEVNFQAVNVSLPPLDVKAVQQWIEKVAASHDKRVGRRKELGYTTRSYRETMHDEIEWLKASGKIA